MDLSYIHDNKVLKSIKDIIQNWLPSCYNSNGLP